MELGIASVAAITAIAYLLGMAVKATEAADKWIPIICGTAGLILGVVAWAMGVPRLATASTACLFPSRARSWCSSRLPTCCL